MDVGCGPGTATKDLANLFETVIGVDHGAEMVSTARASWSDGDRGRIRFEVCEAEQLDRLIDEGVLEAEGVDMITCATSASVFIV